VEFEANCNLCKRFAADKEMQICSGSCDILCVAANNAVLLRNYANAGRAIRSAQHVEGLGGAARPKAHQR
jgi:hypothetical protein